MKDRVPAPEVETLDELYGAEPTQLLQIDPDGIELRSEAADAGRAQSRHA